MLIVAVVEVLVMVPVIVAVVVVVSQSLSTELEMLETLWSCCQELTQRLKISDMAQTKNVDRSGTRRISLPAPVERKAKGELPFNENCTENTSTRRTPSVSESSTSA